MEMDTLLSTHSRGGLCDVKSERTSEYTVRRRLVLTDALILF